MVKLNALYSSLIIIIILEHILWIAANDITTVLQANVYSGLRVTLSQGVGIGLIVGLATTILWPILLNVTKEVKVKK